MSNLEIKIVITIKLTYKLDHDNEFMLPIGKVYTPVKTPEDGLSSLDVFDNFRHPLKQLEGILQRTNGTKFNVENYFNDTKRRGVWRELKGVKDLSIIYFEKLVHEVGGIFIDGAITQLISVDDWVNSFLTHGYFLQAASLDREYSKWQNTYEISSYDYFGKNHGHLTKIEGATPERMIIDIQQNPGHWSYKEGYIDMVSNTMWLGNAFWDVVGKKKQKELLASKMFEVSKLQNGVIKVEYPEPFVDEGTAEVQHELRRLLYGK